MTEAFELWIHAGPADLAAMPASHAVVAFHDANDACVLLAATADAQAFCAKRVPSAAAPGAPARVSALACTSMFEAELAFLHAARRLLPDIYPALIDPWKTWFLRLDFTRGTWQPTNLHDSPPECLCVGPMPDKHAPSKLGEALDDAFDLCRYPAELAKAPQGRACAYKEMGRCPAPCDGSEPWADFSARFHEAAAALASLETFRTAIESRMTESAVRAEFERAAHLKSLAARLAGRSGRGLAHFAHLHAFARIAVIPNTAAGAAVYLCRADGITPLGRIPLDPGFHPIDLTTGLVSIPPLAPAFFPSTHQREELGLITRRLFMARRPESFLTLEQAADPRILLAAARRSPAPDPENEPNPRTA